tara:strand:+ start:1338 stop:1583 length:246 start_codon:yes stop_codon:yes gene_type:complete
MDNITGQKIKTVRNITSKELQAEGWDLNNKFDFIPVIELESGVTLFPSRDSEGNGGGKLFGCDPNTKSQFHVIPPEAMVNE